MGRLVEPRPKVQATGLNPLDDRVIVKPQAAPSQTPGGIIIPDAAKKVPATGLVISTGPGRIDSGNRMRMQVSRGDTVVYNKYAGTEVEHDGETVLILSESDILATVK